MKKIINKVCGCIFGLAPLAATGVFGLAIYQAIPNLVGITIIGSIGIIALWLGLKIFKLVQEEGPLRTLTSLISAPDIDDFVEKHKEEPKGNR